MTSANISPLRFGPRTDVGVLGLYGVYYRFCHLSRLAFNEHCINCQNNYVGRVRVTFDPTAGGIWVVQGAASEHHPLPLHHRSVL